MTTKLKDMSKDELLAVINGLKEELELARSALEDPKKKWTRCKECGGIKDQAALNTASTPVLTAIDSAFYHAWSEGLTPDIGMEVWDLVQSILKSRRTKCEYYPPQD